MSVPRRKQPIGAASNATLIGGMVTEYGLGGGTARPFGRAHCVPITVATGGQRAVVAVNRKRR